MPKAYKYKFLTSNTYRIWFNAKQSIFQCPLISFCYFNSWNFETLFYISSFLISNIIIKGSSWYLIIISIFYFIRILAIIKKYIHPLKPIKMFLFVFTILTHYVEYPIYYCFSSLTHYKTIFPAQFGNDHHDLIMFYFIL